MIAQPARRADHDMGAARQFAALAARIHAADAGDDARAGIVIEPAQFALHLQRQFARGRDDQRQRLAGRAHGLGAVQQGLGHRQADRRWSCPSRSGRKPAGRGPRPLPRAPRSARGWRLYSRARPGRGRGRDAWSETSRELCRMDFAHSLVLLAGKASAVQHCKEICRIPGFSFLAG